MRTNIDIDDELLRSAMDASGLQTEQETVEEALRRLVRGSRQTKLLDDLKKLGPWEGDLHDMRRDKPELRGEW